MSLDEYLTENKIIGIEGIDTRALTRKLRISGAMRGILSTEFSTTPSWSIAPATPPRWPVPIGCRP